MWKPYRICNCTFNYTSIHMKTVIERGRIASLNTFALFFFKQLCNSFIYLVVGVRG